MQSAGLCRSLLAQPNGARFFGEQWLACSKRPSRKLQLIQFLFAPEKPRGVREVWRSQTCNPAVAFLLLPFLWRSKENEVSEGGRVSAE
ncbi:hypothetical protein A7P99_02620 [Eikenella sp. NML120348]|nr:hypothetical protein A7P99_02620 [Eikenella sp. NML120348]